MKIHCISDTHNKHKQIYLPGGDIVIHAGDATGRGHSGEIENFLKWYSKQNYAYKIFVPGNHDFGFEKKPKKYIEMASKYGIILLNDSGWEVPNFDTGEKIKIWGSPVTPEFFNWAFNRRVDKALPPWIDPYHSNEKINPWIKPHWDKIPDDTDILITHGPPKNILDRCRDMYDRNSTVSVGCPHLLDAIKLKKPKLHVFGHIHEQHGIISEDGTVFCNASQLTDQYIVGYKPQEFTLKNGVIEYE